MSTPEFNLSGDIYRRSWSTVDSGGCLAMRRPSAKSNIIGKRQDFSDSKGNGGAN
jgi:hypothetical protein